MTAQRIAKAQYLSQHMRKSAITALATGHSAAVAHGDTKWLPTSRYVDERLESIDQALDHLRTLTPHCGQKRPLFLVQALLEETAGSLKETMPPELPFLINTEGMPQRLRIAVIMREWLLVSQHPRREEHLRQFLLGYEEVSPLCLAEIRLIGIALRLAVAEKCRLLPSAEKSTHRQLLPRLLQRLADTCRFISRTDWKRVGEAVSPVHLLLQHDPSQTYERMDFPTRDAYRASVEQLSRILHTSEDETVKSAMALAEREEAPVGEFLLGPGRECLIERLRNGRSPHGNSLNGKAGNGDSR